MAPVSAPDHEIIVVTPEINELRQQCYDIRIAVFVSEQGELLVGFSGPAVTITARFLRRRRIRPVIITGDHLPS
jgi:hypothetical protein